MLTESPVGEVSTGEEYVFNPDDWSYDYSYVPYDELPTVKTYTALWKYAAPILLLAGTLGNVFSILVLSRKSLRASATSVFLMTLAVSDTMILNTGLLRQWIKYTFELDIRNVSDSACKFHWAITYFSFYLSPWLLANVAIERFVAVFLPVKHKSLYSWKRAVIAVSVTMVCLGLITSHFYFTYNLVPYVNCYLKTQVLQILGQRLAENTYHLGNRSTIFHHDHHQFCYHHSLCCSRSGRQENGVDDRDTTHSQFGFPSPYQSGWRFLHHGVASDRRHTHLGGQCEVRPVLHRSQPAGLPQQCHQLPPICGNWQEIQGGTLQNVWQRQQSWSSHYHWNCRLTEENAKHAG